MFSDDVKVAEAQKIMLELLVEFHKICVANNLTYWLDAGTLLGAVRHKGFIPWDDDCDVSMPREDYEKFLKLAPNFLSQNVFLQTKESDPGWNLDYAKLRRNDTILLGKTEDGSENYHHGIFLDIFPYDYYPSLWFMAWSRWPRLLARRRKKNKKGSLKRILMGLYTNVILCVPSEITKFVMRYLRKRHYLYSKPEYDYFSYGLDTEPCLVRDTRKIDILPVKLGEKIFEGYDFYLPNKPDDVLKANFGADYMTLPPLEKRHAHARFISIGDDKERVTK